MQIAHAERLVAHLGQHAAFVRRVYVAIVVIDHGAYTDACRAHKVDVAGLERGQH